MFIYFTKDWFTQIPLEHSLTLSNQLTCLSLLFPVPEKVDNIFGVSNPIHELLAKAKNIERFKASTVVHLERQETVPIFEKYRVFFFFWLLKYLYQSKSSMLWHLQTHILCLMIMMMVNRLSYWQTNTRRWGLHKHTSCSREQSNAIPDAGMFSISCDSLGAQHGYYLKTRWDFQGSLL